MNLPAVSPLRPPPHQEEPFATQLREVSQRSECGNCRRGGGRNSWPAHRSWAGGVVPEPNDSLTRQVGELALALAEQPLETGLGWPHHYWGFRLCPETH